MRMSLFAALVVVSPTLVAAPLTVTVKRTIGDEPFTGRVLLVATKSEPRPVVRSLNWFHPEPAFAIEVRGWKAAAAVIFDDTAISHPHPLGKLPKGTYWLQAIVDRDLGGISCFDSPGNWYSKPKKVVFDPAEPQSVELVVEKAVVEREFAESARVKLVDIPSPLLTKFHGKPMRQRAGVALPPSYAENPDKKYPVVYEITGFGGDHTYASFQSVRKAGDLDGIEAIWVVLDANCRLGHHVFADSANNGPVGQALIDELIPHIEATYRGNGKRLVTGHSSGGWSSLWLQTTYPESFAGCWSTSPDPVDFRDFQRVNIYETNANLFTDADGKPRDLSRGDRGRTLQFQSFSAMEDVMGRGGQLASFEAVFSPKMPDGTPRKLWDRKTGKIDPETAKAWEKYDIRLRLERDWPTVGPKLAGKINVWMGDIDTFYLDGAARLLKASQAKLAGGGTIEMIPKKTHALLDRDLTTRMKKEMKAALTK